MVPSGPASDVERLYRNRFGPAERAAKARVWQAVVEDFLQRWVRGGDAVLDVGCGFGEFLNHVQRNGAGKVRAVALPQVVEGALGNAARLRIAW